VTCAVHKARSKANLFFKTAVLVFPSEPAIERNVKMEGQGCMHSSI